MGHKERRVTVDLLVYPGQSGAAEGRANGALWVLMVSRDQLETREKRELKEAKDRMVHLEGMVRLVCLVIRVLLVLRDPWAIEVISESLDPKDPLA